MCDKNFAFFHPKSLITNHCRNFVAKTICLNKIQWWRHCYTKIVAVFNICHICNRLEIEIF